MVRIHNKKIVREIYSQFHWNCISCTTYQSIEPSNKNIEYEHANNLWLIRHKACVHLYTFFYNLTSRMLGTADITRLFINSSFILVDDWVTLKVTIFALYILWVMVMAALSCANGIDWNWGNFGSQTAWLGVFG